MFVNFHVNMIVFQNLNIPQIYYVSPLKKFEYENCQMVLMVQ